jgi:hypothetical protein
MRWDAGATPGAIITLTVIPAHDFVALNVPQAERNAAVIANIPRRNDRSVRQTVDYNALVQQSCGKGLLVISCECATPNLCAQVRSQICPRGLTTPQSLKQPLCDLTLAEILGGLW